MVILVTALAEEGTPGRSAAKASQQRLRLASLPLQPIAKMSTAPKPVWRAPRPILAPSRTRSTIVFSVEPLKVPHPWPLACLMVLLGPHPPPKDDTAEGSPNGLLQAGATVWDGRCSVCDSTTRRSGRTKHPGRICCPGASIRPHPRPCPRPRLRNILRPAAPCLHPPSDTHFSLIRTSLLVTSTDLARCICVHCLQARVVESPAAAVTYSAHSRSLPTRRLHITQHWMCSCLTITRLSPVSISDSSFPAQASSLPLLPGRWSPTRLNSSSWSI